VPRKKNTQRLTKPRKRTNVPTFLPEDEDTFDSSFLSKEEENLLAKTNEPESDSSKAQAAERMAQRDFDPVEKSMDMALGKGNQGYLHPYALQLDFHVNALHESLKNISIKNTAGTLTDEDLDSVKTLLDEISVESRRELSNDYVPPEVRSKHILDLMRYRYPRLKDTEVSGSLEITMPQLELVLNEK